MEDAARLLDAQPFIQQLQVKGRVIHFLSAADAKHPDSQDRGRHHVHALPGLRPGFQGQYFDRHLVNRIGLGHRDKAVDSGNERIGLPLEGGGQAVVHRLQFGGGVTVEPRHFVHRQVRVAEEFR